MSQNISKKSNNKGLQAFKALRKQAKENGIQDMSLDSINEEINIVRKQMQTSQVASNNDK